MRFSSDLLAQLAASIGTAELDFFDQELRIANQLVAIARVPKFQPLLSGLSATVAFRTSFNITSQLGQVASQGAVQATVCTLGRGLWRVSASLHHLANFSQASDGSIAEGALRLLDPNLAANILLRSYASATPQHQRGVWDWLFLEDSWSLQIQVGATGVGQTQEIRACVTGSRFL